jgi:hypothetical protein
MKTRAALILTAAMAVLALAPAAAKDKITKPRSSEVVLVARFVVSPGIDRDFYSHYVAFKAPGIEAEADKSLKGRVPDESVYLQTQEPDKSAWRMTWNYTGSLGEVGFAKVSIPKKREIQVNGARVYLVDNAFLYFDLPIVRKISVPEGVNYIYLGTFTYSIKDEYFTISDIAKSDEFDAAAEAVAKAYGKDAQLTRANLLALDPADAKK